MKTGNIDKKEEKPIKRESTRLSDGAVVKNQTPVLITILPVLSMLTAILINILKGASGVNTAKLGIVTLILTGVIFYYIRMNADSILNKALSKTIITVGYLGSIILLLLIPEPEVFSFWMIGGLITAMLLDSRLGLIMHFDLSFIMGITFVFRPEVIFQVLIIGLLMSMLSNALKNKATIIYGAIIILSTNITLAFVMNNFLFETNRNYNYLKSLFSILAVLVIGFFLSSIYLKKNKQEDMKPAETIPEDNENAAVEEGRIAIVQETSAEAVVKIEELKAEQEDNVKKEALQTVEEALSEVIDSSELQHSLGMRTSYEVLCDTENDLMKKLKEFSEALYQHALYIGDLSCRAAQVVGANELLAKAGGYYHEIGKINGKNYIEESLLIAEDYAFPKELTAILKEHNIKYEKPGSIEAVIVMLSDSVVSTIEYIEKTSDHKYTTNKIIDNIFQMRMEKGTFDVSNLSLKHFKALKEFYQKEFQ